MSEETVSSEGQEQVHSVTRRRFMQATAIGGGAAVMAKSASAERACTLIGDFSLHPNCARTLNFICDYPVKYLFTDPFHRVISAAEGKVSADDWSKGKKLRDELAKDESCTLESLFINHEGAWPGRVANECYLKRKEFAFPFYGLASAERSAIKKFLEPEDGVQKFLDAFGTDTLDTIYTTLAKDMHYSKLHLIQQAKRLGILKFHHTIAEESIHSWGAPLDKGKCAYYTGTMWKCKSGREDDVCGTVPPTGGELEAGSDLCS